jgi:hypothetical protein
MSLRDLMDGLKEKANELKTEALKFKKISWTNDNVKSLGVHHGYNVFFV